LAAGLVALAAAYSLLTDLAVAGEPTRPPAAAASRQTSIISLKHAKATAMARLLREMFPDKSSAISFAADESSNTIIVAAPPLEIGKIEELIAKVDVAQAAAPDTARQIQTFVFRLKYAEAARVADLLTTMFGAKAPAKSVTITTDERTNSIFVAASAPEIAEIKSLIDKLDIPQDQGGSSRLPRVFQLRSIEPDKAVEGALRLVFSGTTSGNFAVDRTRKLVIVSADDATLRTVEKLLDNLDRQISDQPEPEVMVRVAWIVNGPARDDAPPLPDDLKDALKGLAQLGLDRPRLAGQTLVAARANARFQAKGVAKLDSPCQFSVAGRLIDKKAGPGAVDISIRARRGEEEIGSLETEISAPLGHLVVLGVTPTGSQTSVFVIQLLPSLAKNPGKAR
jgi:hypothetical protein